MRIAFVLNPAARGGRTAREADAVLADARAAGLDATLHVTAGPRDAARIARTAATSGTADAVVAVGGDGTVHEVADGLLTAGTDVPFGLVPLGTGNDYAKLLAIPRDRHEALRALATTPVRRFDAIRVRWRSDGRDDIDPEAWTKGTCVNTLGVGLDARVAAEAVRFKRYGNLAAYLLAVVAALRGWRSPHARIWLDETPEPFFDGPFFLCTVGNGTHSGGSYALTPTAVPDDGVLDVCVVREQPLWRVPYLLLLAMRGRHLGQPGVYAARACRIRVDVAADCSLHADGELQSTAVRTVEAEVWPRALPVIG